MTQPSGPTVGRIVHVTATDGECLPAIVVKVGDRSITAGVFSAVGYNPLVVQDETSGHEPNTWHWPERA